MFYTGGQPKTSSTRPSSTSSKPASVTSGYDRYEPLEVAPSACRGDRDSTTGALSHKDRLPEATCAVCWGALRSSTAGFPADRPEHLSLSSSLGQGNNHDDDDLASLGMESAGRGGATCVHRPYYCPRAGQTRTRSMAQPRPPPPPLPLPTAHLQLRQPTWGTCIRRTLCMTARACA